jgi:glucosamine--fructose-6-phosphate aminotransferase (isomerizing)
VLNGLKKLEYRGYDSAGIAVLEDGQISIRREAGKLNHLEDLINSNPIHGNVGIGHTRWATHGEPNARNAHPHVGTTGKFVIVHNGIVENYLSLREELSSEGVKFNSDTDSETIIHLIEKYYSVYQNLEKAVLKALNDLKGAHGILVFSTNEPDKIIAARIGNAGGVVIGKGIDEMFIASDLPAILEHTREVLFMGPNQVCVVSKDGVALEDLAGQALNSSFEHVSWDPITAEKGKYRHFMQKEIHEQVSALSDTLAGRIDFDDNRILLHDLKVTKNDARKIKKIFITACGTAAHAGMVGKY